MAQADSPESAGAPRPPHAIIRVLSGVTPERFFRPTFRPGNHDHERHHSIARAALSRRSRLPAYRHRRSVCYAGSTEAVPATARRPELRRPRLSQPLGLLHGQPQPARHRCHRASAGLRAAAYCRHGRHRYRRADRLAHLTGRTSVRQGHRQCYGPSQQRRAGGRGEALPGPLRGLGRRRPAGPSHRSERN